MKIASLSNNPSRRYVDFANAVAGLLAICVCLINCNNVSAHNNNQNELEKLREIERKVQVVVEKSMESTVAISDGVGFGSGVIVSPEGLVLTAGHVMGNGRPGTEYEIIFPSGKVARARALGKNLNLDAGMVQLIGPGPWPFVELAEADVEPSQWVVCLGHSGGYELGRKPPVRTGRVLGKRNGQLLSDAVLIGGDSGGPLFNLEGKLVGIHSSIGDSVAENRHVPISTYRTHWNRMARGESWGQLPELARKKEKRKRTPDIAERVPDTDRVPPARQAKLGVVVDKSAGAAIVESVRDFSPAKRVGIQAGDIIKTFDGRNVTGPDHLIELVRSKEIGDSVAVRVQRGGYELNFRIILDVLQ